MIVLAYCNCILDLGRKLSYSSVVRKTSCCRSLINRAHAEEIIGKGIGRRASHRDVEKIQNEKFHQWFRSHIMQLERENGIYGVKDDIRWLARGPVVAAKRGKDWS